MLQLDAYPYIFIAIEPIDFRAGMNRLIAICKQQFQLDPWAGYLFVFTNRKRIALKLLFYDKQGFWLCHKRLSKGRFADWPKAHQAVITLTSAQTHVLLNNGNPMQVETAPDFRKT